MVILFFIIGSFSEHVKTNVKKNVMILCYFLSKPEWKQKQTETEVG